MISSPLVLKGIATTITLGVSLFSASTVALAADIPLQDTLQVHRIINPHGSVWIKDNLKVTGRTNVRSKLPNGFDSNAFVVNVMPSDTTNTTTSQYGLVVRNRPSATASDALLVLKNADSDSTVGAAIKIINNGGNFTNIIDNEGTLISGTEINLLDNGISLNELTDSGTFTANTVDINGGTIDNTTIGATTPTAATFTQLTAMKQTFNKQAFTMSTTGAATENLTPTSAYIEITGQDDATDAINIQTTVAQEGDTVVLANTGSVAVVINALPNVRLSGNTSATLEPLSTLSLIFDGTNWLQTARSNNS